MRIYHDPNFTLNELLEYHAPMILETEHGTYVDLHSLNVVNLLGHAPTRKAITEFNGLVLGYVEFQVSASELLLSETIELSNLALEKFKISNFLSLRHLLYETNTEKRLLKIENSLENLYAIVSLCTEFALRNRQFFEDKKFEILLEILSLLEMKKLVERYGLQMHMPQPFLFQVDLANVTLEVAHNFTTEAEKLSDKLTKKIPELYDSSRQKITVLDKLLTSIDRKSLGRVLYTFTSINELISDLLYLKGLISEFEGIFNSEERPETGS